MGKVIPTAPALLPALSEVHKNCRRSNPLPRPPTNSKKNVVPIGNFSINAQCFCFETCLYICLQILSDRWTFMFSKLSARCLLSCCPCAVSHEILEVGLEPTISSLGGRRLIHQATRAWNIFKNQIHLNLVQFLANCRRGRDGSVRTSGPRDGNQATCVTWPSISMTSVDVRSVATTFVSFLFFVYRCSRKT